MSSSSIEAASRRRQTRLRREYLYRKSLEGHERVVYEQKKKIREALANGITTLPTELRASYDKIRKQVDGDDTNTEQLCINHIDDEYGDNVGILDPCVCVTTSRDPSSRLKQFAKEIKLLFPNSQRLNRGTIRIDELVSTAKSYMECTDLIIVQETRGEPDGLIICHLPLGPTAFFNISNAILRHDLQPSAAPMSESYPHIILHNFNTELGKRVGNILKCLFPIPKPDTKRIVTFSNDNDFISFRHHMYSKTKPGSSYHTGDSDNTNNTTDNNNNNDTAIKSIELHEVGPRFEMRLYQIRLGTLDQKEADNEYVLRPYQNTATKRQVL